METSLLNFIPVAYIISIPVTMQLLVSQNHYVFFYEVGMCIFCGKLGF